MQITVQPEKKQKTGILSTTVAKNRLDGIS